MNDYNRNERNCQEKKSEKSTKFYKNTRIKDRFLPVFSTKTGKRG